MSTLNREVIPDYGSHPVAEPCQPILLRAQEDRNCSGLGRKILEASKLRSKPLHDENGLKTFALVFEKGDEVRERLLEFANTNRFADAHARTIKDSSPRTSRGALVHRQYCAKGRQAEAACARARRQGRRHGPWSFP